MKQRNLFYEKSSESIQKGGYNNDKITFILQFVGKNKKILDIGCNDGFIGFKLLKNGNDVYGVDLVKRDVQRAKKRGMKARVVDVEHQQFPYPQNCFDGILFTDVIEHIFDTDLILEKIYRILKPGGFLIITTPNVCSLARRLMLLFGKNPFLEYSSTVLYKNYPPVGHIRYYLRSTLHEQLIRHKFKNIHIFGDRINFGVFSSRFLGLLFPSLAVDILCTCKK